MKWNLQFFFLRRNLLQIDTQITCIKTRLSFPKKTDNMNKEGKLGNGSQKNIFI